MKARVLVFLGVIAVAALLGGCSRSRVSMLTAPPFEGRSYGRYPGTAVSTENRYRIGIGDQVAVHVRNHPEFEGDLKVDSTGVVTLPLVLEEVPLVGLTRGEAAQAVGDALRKYVQKEPRVWVELEDPNSRFVYVLGAVRAPGKYAMRAERLYVREAVERAGWPLREAAINRSRLVSSKPERAAERCIRLGDIIYHGDLSSNYELEPGDIVYVPYSYVSAFVYHASQILRPFSTLINYDETAYDLSLMPRASNRGDSNNNSNNE